MLGLRFTATQTILFIPLCTFQAALIQGHLNYGMMTDLANRGVTAKSYTDIIISKVVVSITQDKNKKYIEAGTTTTFRKSVT